MCGPMPEAAGNPTYTRDGDGLKFLHLQPLGDWGYGSSSGWRSQLRVWNAEGSDMSAWSDTAQDYGWRLPSIQERTAKVSGCSPMPTAHCGYWWAATQGNGSGRRIHPNSASAAKPRAVPVCSLGVSIHGRGGDQRRLLQERRSPPPRWPRRSTTCCCFGRTTICWSLRDLVLGCAEDLGEEGPDAMWGRGVLSFNCLFTAQGELRDPRTDAILSGGIYGPWRVCTAGRWTRRSSPVAQSRVWIPPVETSPTR